MDKIVPSFQKSLFDGSKDFIEDIVEVGIDSVLGEGLLKEIPIVGFLIGTKNVVQNLQDRNLLNQTLQFIKEFNSGSIDTRKLSKYKEDISQDNGKAEKELGRVLLILNRILDSKKSKILANFYRNYVNGRISWEVFCELSSVLEMLFISDIKILEDIASNELTDNEDIELYPIDRLNALGLIRKNITVWEESMDLNVLVLSPLGIKLIECKDF